MTALRPRLSSLRWLPAAGLRPAAGLLLAACLPLAACGGTPAARPVESSPPPGAPVAPVADAPPPDPWEALDAEGLRAYLAEQARARLAEVQPGLDLGALDGYLGDHATAPAISGRAVERLFDLAMVDLARGALDRAEGTVRLVRARARNRNSAFAGTTLLCEIARRRAGDDPQAQEAAVAAVLRELPRPRLGASTVVFQLYQSQEQVAANLAQTKTQMLSLETASSALFFSEILPSIVTHRDRFLAAAAAVRAEHERRPEPRPYAFSTEDLARARGAREVRIAVWDVGTNPALFEAQLFSSPTEEPNGRDDDGNGLVDDIHGVVSDGGAPHTALLYEPGAEVLERYTPFLRGIMDLRAGLASTEAAQRVLALLRSVTDVPTLLELERNLDAVGEWAHGTHVAGIMVAGNPHARLAIFRSAWAGEARTYYHRGPTDAELAQERANVEAIAEFIGRHEIRVVNASLGFGSDYVEDQLRHEGDLYASDAQVRARAEVIHQHRARTFSMVFERCPDTLFVVAAGNSNRDVVEYGDVPASLDHPNLLVVGAVDRFGGWATFTNSNPERVRVFDHGVEVDSLIPNGERVPLSGTSMASPNVANLAGKILAVAPALGPAQVIEAIVTTGDPIASPFDGRIANERRALARARALARGR